jgi:hypothetical protein
MSEFYSIAIGIFIGFAFGVGCALAVMYTIYTNGYKTGVADSLAEQKPKRYFEALAVANKRLAKLRSRCTP